jgi:hypothetical protein
MGNWVFLAGTEYGSAFNGASKLRWYDTALTTAYAGTASLLTRTGTYAPLTGDVTVHDSSLYVMPCYQYLSAGNYWAGNRYALSNVDVEAHIYPCAANAAPSTPVIFGASLYAVQAQMVCRVDPTAFITLTTLPGNGVLAASSSKLFAFYNDETALKYVSSSNGVSWSAPVSASLIAMDGIDADVYGSTYGIVYNGAGLFLFTSNGGTAWAGASGSPSIGPSTPFHGVWANALGAFAAVGTHLYKTTNGTSWTDLGEVLDGEVVNDIAFGNSMYMVVGAGGVAKTTTDFSTFTAFTGVDFAYHDIYAVTYTTEAISAASGTPITGFVRLDTSTGTLVARTVALYDYVTKELVDTTVSNGSGVWTFSSVAPGQYFAVAIPEAADITAGRDFDALGIITVT